MNVTFSCKVLSRWAQLVSVFSRMCKFSRIVIYRAKSRRSVLEWKYLLILFNRNNCSLSVGVFSFSLIWQSIAAQFLTFVRKGEQIFVEKDSPSSTTTKSSFFSRSANFGNVSLTHKIAELCMFWNSAIYPKQINHRVYQIPKEGGVVNRFLTARRHFWIPWSEQTHCMEKGQSFFFSRLARPSLRSRKTLTPRFTYFFTHFEEKKNCFAVYPCTERKNFLS